MYILFIEQHISSMLYLKIGTQSLTSAADRNCAMFLKILECIHRTTYIFNAIFEDWHTSGVWKFRQVHQVRPLLCCCLRHTSKIILLFHPLWSIFAFSSDMSSLNCSPQIERETFSESGRRSVAKETFSDSERFSVTQKDYR